MALPPGFLDELRNRTSLAGVVGRKVAWDTRKTNAAKGDYWAPCPFHQEKTASFHVDDRKGFYYCFGCHAKGDALTFVRETENVGFVEAVEILAREAGMTMPAPDPAERARAERAGGLAEIMEEAVRFYRLQLRTAAAAQARSYLEGRGRGEATWTRFEIGFAPDSRTALTEHLRRRDIPEERILEAGLAARPEGGGASYDRFRDRIVFPIRDARGRCIAFGGRAMRSDARAKYLNSPETPLFDKGRTLYNHGPARAAAGRGLPLVVAEGYMDVIALVEAGFEAAVAPLGTAITEAQLEMLWRISPEPVIALDGDAAGLNAARRLVDLALPLLAAGRSLRFCLLPQGRDPDDLIRAEGARAMQALIEGAGPMIELLWTRETEGLVLDSPERRAALDARLRRLLETISDTSVRAHYRAEFRDRRAALFAPSAPRRGARARPSARWRAGSGGAGGANGHALAASASARSSLLGRASAVRIEERLREAVIVAICATTPEVIAGFESELEALELQDGELARLLSRLLARHHGDSVDAAGLAGLDAVLVLGHVRNTPAVRAPGDPALAGVALREELEKLAAGRAALREIEEAMHDVSTIADEHLTWRLAEATRLRERAERGAFAEDATEFTTAPNGVMVSRAEKGAFDALLGNIPMEKRRPGKP